MRISRKLVEGGPHLPQEIIDLILDQLSPQDKKKTLRTLCLASRSLCSVGQRRLFHAIRLSEPNYGCDPRLDELLQAFTRNPSLGTHVKELRIYDSSCNPEDWKRFPTWLWWNSPWLSTDDRLPYILRALPNLQCLHLAGYLASYIPQTSSRMMVSCISAKSKKALFNAMCSPTVIRLIFRYVAFQTVYELTKMLQGTSNLKHLELRGVDIAETSPFNRAKLSSLSPSDPAPVALESFVCYVTPRWLATKCFSLPIFDWRCLRKLHLAWLQGVDFDAIFRIMHSSSVLEDLHICMAVSTIKPKEDVQLKPVNLCTLRTLRFNLNLLSATHVQTHFYLTFLDWWCRSLESSKPSRLCDVSIDVCVHLTIFRNIDYFVSPQWMRLDSLLANGSSSVQLKLAANVDSVEYYREETGQYISAALGDVFPQMRSKGALTTVHTQCSMNDYMDVKRRH